MMSVLVEKTKQALVEEGLLDREQLTAAEKESKQEKESLGRVLIDSGFMSEEKLANFIADKIQIPYVDLKKYTIDARVLELVPEKTAHRYNVLPLFLIEEVLTVATSDPLNVVLLDELTSLTGYRIEPVIASADGLRQAINQWYGVGDARRDLIGQLSTELKKVECIIGPQEHADSALRDLRLRAEEEETVKFVNKLVVQGVLENASDIHLEPRKNVLEIRFRIDGVLFPRHLVPIKQGLAIAARLKLMAGLEIGAKKALQEGWTRLSIRNQFIDMQVALFPSLHGENIVLKLTNKTREVPALSELGFSSEELGEFLKVIKEKRGLILVSGPSGSGKTTTIYSALKGLLSSERSIVTIEDPIEYELEGAVQCQVDLRAGITYPEALNSLLRQDPDVIYVGEIKDFETAGLVVRAALTGRLVFGTLHAGNSFEALTMLYDMGLNPGLLESVLISSIAQRLVRKICPRCKRDYAPNERTLQELGLGSSTRFFRGEGCKHCGQSGYRGMSTIFEVLKINKEVRKLISNFTSEEEIMEAAWSDGMRSLFDDGLSKVVNGTTTLEELKRVLYPHFLGHPLQRSSPSTEA